jgi:hypothetical protein
VFDTCRIELKLLGRNIAKRLEPVAQRNGMFIAFATAVGATASDGGELVRLVKKWTSSRHVQILSFDQLAYEDSVARDVSFCEDCRTPA